MIFSIPKEDVLKLLKLQLSNFFMLNDFEESLLDKYFELVLKRCEFCFSKNLNKYYFRNDEIYFNPYHSVQYMTFLYYYSNTLYEAKSQSTILCDKIYCLNKMLNGVDLLYAIALPDFFMAEHPVGSVIGRAEIGGGFGFFQNCTVGGVTREGGQEVYPVIGKNVHLYANSSIIGECLIGDNVEVGAGALIKNQNIPANSIVFGHSPNLIIRPKNKNYEIL